MNKFLPFCITLLLLAGISAAYSQRAAQVGLFLGTAYYMGDINPNRHFYHPGISAGLLYRYNLNSRYAIRASGTYGQFSGSDLDFPELLHPDRPLSPATFSTSLLDLALLAEYNFMPFVTGVPGWAYTPYLTTGISAALVLSTDRTADNLASLPFGIGMKFNLAKRVTAGVEWTFRKTFNDRIDGLENPSGVRSVLHNNDWYSFLGITITYKFFNFAVDCPAYQ